jgi:hypothetical protein
MVINEEGALDGHYSKLAISHSIIDAPLMNNEIIN